MQFTRPKISMALKAQKMQSLFAKTTNREENEMTPCEKLGYKVGDEFEFTGDSHHGYRRGETVTLIKDDKSQAPWFKCGTRNHCAYLHDIKPLRITLRPGDYVSTEGMTKDQYHAVARAFMGAGASKFGDEDKRDRWTRVVWSSNNKLIGSHGCDECSRELTITQVLNATNAGNAQPEEAKMHLTDQLEQAIKSRDEAQEEVERLQAEWDAAYPNISGAPKEDLSDPANWRAGDIVECTYSATHLYTAGREYKCEVRADGNVIVLDNSEDGTGTAAIHTLSKFRFVRRP